MRAPISYDAVFSTTLPIQTWATLTGIYKKVDAVLLNVPTKERQGEKFVSTWRPLVALISVAIRLKTFSYSAGELTLFTDAPLLATEVSDAWSIVSGLAHEHRSGKKLKQVFVQRCCDEAAKAFGILDSPDVCRRHIPSALLAAYSLPEEFLAQVESVLPEQPWYPGVQYDVASKLDCKPSKASRAIQQLIVAGKRKRQRNGVVYGSDGSVVAVDANRVPQSAVELNAIGHRWSYDGD